MNKKPRIGMEEEKEMETKKKKEFFDEREEEKTKSEKTRFCFRGGKQETKKQEKFMENTYDVVMCFLLGTELRKKRKGMELRKEKKGNEKTKEKEGEKQWMSFQMK